jgi:autophagy-related protein 9
LTVYDEDVLNVEHMLTTITTLGVVIGICRSMIPDEVKTTMVERVPD